MTRVGEGPSMQIQIILANRMNGRFKSLDIAFWTKVPIGNDLAARAIAVYLLTDHALLGHFCSDLFLADLLAKRT